LAKHSPNEGEVEARVQNLRCAEKHKVHSPSLPIFSQPPSFSTMMKYHHIIFSSFRNHQDNNFLLIKFVHFLQPACDYCSIVICDMLRMELKYSSNSQVHDKEDLVEELNGQLILVTKITLLLMGVF